MEKRKARIQNIEEERRYDGRDKSKDRNRMEFREYLC